MQGRVAQEQSIPALEVTAIGTSVETPILVAVTARDFMGVDLMAAAADMAAADTAANQHALAGAVADRRELELELSQQRAAE
jgi:hypothetical protein